MPRRMTFPDACPRCGHAGPGGPTCPRCGVVFAKMRGPALIPVPTAPAAPESRSAPLVLVLLAGLLGIAVTFRLLRPAPSAFPSPATSAEPALPRADLAGFGPALAGPPSAPLLTPLVLPSSVPGVNVDERRRASELGARVNAMASLSSSDIETAEALASAHRDEPGLQRLLASTLAVAGWQERGRRRFREAAGLLERAATVAPDEIPVWLALLDVHLEAGDWPAAEAAARGALLREQRHPRALRGLGYALLRQDRSREAEEALLAALDAGPDSATQALLDRVRKGLHDERGMAAQNLSHFHVRFDGEEHADVGREILRALERHYASLAGTLGHQPAQPIPVILFSRRAYYDARGAPAWAGGDYDALDGRIRVPIGGLTSSLTPDLDGTLIHELTHAFIADRTRGVAPHEVHEGLAQYMEGKRVGGELTEAQLTALADGRVRGVAGFYLSSLALVEHLLASRGMGGMNELLSAMGETGSVDEAFARVYGQTFSEVVRAWRQRLAQQHGGLR